MATALYSIGRFVGSHRALTIVALVAVLGTCTYIDRQSDEVRRAEAQRTAAEASQQATNRRAESEATESKYRAILAESCLVSGDKMKVASREMQAGHAQRAFEALQDCRDYLSDPQVKALYLKSMSIAREKEAAETKRAVVAEAVAAKRVAAGERAGRKKQGAYVGMTQQDVLNSSWGRPQHVNRTTTALGTREQWVYGIGSYLYFEDGVLTAIQN